MTNGLNTLKERGFIAQMTHEDEMMQLFENEKVTFYIGYDPTANSLHIGHYLTFMAMSWLQQAGHRPIVLMGGGTGMVGDPTGRTESRRVMTVDEIDKNVANFKLQAAKFIDFSDDRAIMVNNADWLRPLNYLEFIREYGLHFSVNKMLSADTYKTKLEKGLSFFELNYMVMQAYDFLELNRRFSCVVQGGGNDQWSNIIAGVDLIRRVEARPAFGFTCNLLVRPDGQKMGKSFGGVTWLDAAKTPVFDFYQFFRNTHDAQVGQFLSMLTFLPMDEIKSLEGGDVNRAKEVLAYEVTKIVHGEDAAEQAKNSAKALFSGGGDSKHMPSFTLTITDFGDAQALNITDLLVLTGLAPSKSEARRNITQGGVAIGGEKIDNPAHMVQTTDFVDGNLIIQKGKKTFLKVIYEN